MHCSHMLLELLVVGPFLALQGFFAEFPVLSRQKGKNVTFSMFKSIAEIRTHSGQWLGRWTGSPDLFHSIG